MQLLPICFLLLILTELWSHALQSMGAVPSTKCIYVSDSAPCGGANHHLYALWVGNMQACVLVQEQCRHNAILMRYQAPCGLACKHVSAPHRMLRRLFVAPAGAVTITTMTPRLMQQK